MSKLTFRDKIRIGLPQIFLIFSLIAVGGACGKKDPKAVGPGGPAAVAPPVSNNPTTTPPPTTTYSQIAQNIIGTYSGMLYTNTNHAKGSAIIKLNANNALGISLTVSHPTLSPGMAASANPYSIAGSLIYYSAPWNGSLGQIEGRQVWISGIIIDYANPAVPRLYLTINAVDYDYNSFGPWDLFYWSTFQNEGSNWIRIDPLLKVGPL